MDAGTLVYPDLADHVIQSEESLSLDRASVAGSVTRMDGFGVTVSNTARWEMALNGEASRSYF